MSPAAVRKILGNSSLPEKRPSASIVPLFARKTEDNETVRRHQFAVQSAMMAEALKNTPVRDEALYFVQNQAPRYTPAEEATIANQAATQGVKGFAFRP